MIYLKLEEHNISFFYRSNLSINESEIGQWLDENNIIYSVTDYKLFIDVSNADEYIFILSMSFDDDADAAGFILRWGSTISSPIAI